MPVTDCSLAEKQFLIQTIYKRSKRYFDIPRLNSIEQKESLTRRKPPSQNHSFQSRLKESFMNAESAMEERVLEGLTSYKRKLFNEETEDTEGSRTFDMQKMISREEYVRGKPATYNESQFHNYSMVHYNKSLDFDKLLGRREAEGKEERYGEVGADRVGKCHESLVFDRSALKCVTLIKEGKVRKAQIDGRSGIALEDIKRGEDFSRVSQPAQMQFWSGKGKEAPSQMDNRLLKHNQYFWRNLNNTKIDFMVIKRKNDMRLKRIDGIRAKKQITDKRDQMCNELFFLRNK